MSLLSPVIGTGYQQTNRQHENPMSSITLNSVYNEVAFNEKSAITKENLHTKYFPFTYKYITLNKKQPVMKENLCIFFFFSKKYAENLLHYRQLFVKGDVFIGEWHVFGVEVFLCYSQFFIKSNFIIGRVECIYCMYVLKPKNDPSPGE